MDNLTISEYESYDGNSILYACIAVGCIVGIFIAAACIFVLLYVLRKTSSNESSAQTTTNDSENRPRRQLNEEEERERLEQVRQDNLELMEMQADLQRPRTKFTPPVITGVCSTRQEGCCKGRNNGCCHLDRSKCCTRSFTLNCDYRLRVVGSCINETDDRRCCINTNGGCCALNSNNCCTKCPDLCNFTKCSDWTNGCCINRKRGGCCNLKDDGCCDIKGAKNCTNGGAGGQCPDPSGMKWALGNAYPCCFNRKGGCCVTGTLCCTTLPNRCIKNEASNSN